MLILPQLVKQDLSEEEEHAEMMVMQYWQLPEGPSEQASQLDSIRLL